MTSLMALTILLLPATAFGQDGAGGNSSSWLTLALILAPGVIIMALFFVVMRRNRADVAKAHEQMKFARQHMATMEQKTERMVELLESIDRKLAERA
ncbi:hypothetical protein [Aquisphaera insulae]|uniref:hypothetical protein n=1 Tax=Aquisphaera insulae TaxID=2712864 RepID=UPI0013EB0309|nr:hypothetical protein [Aquisphaera insulae]